MGHVCVYKTQYIRYIFYGYIGAKCVPVGVWSAKYMGGGGSQRTWALWALESLVDRRALSSEVSAGPSLMAVIP